MRPPSTDGAASNCYEDQLDTDEGIWQIANRNEMLDTGSCESRGDQTDDQSSKVLEVRRTLIKKSD